jgi:hypothetical protein
VLRAVAKLRKELAATKPKLGRGRPSSAAARKAKRRRQRIDEKAGDLFEHRCLFVQHELTPGEWRTLSRITRGQRELRTVRDIIDEVYRLFDPRCRSDTALERLARLRRRVRRFKRIGKTLQKQFSPTLEKALTFLDDKLPPSTSNAVERGYRRHRKMQKTSIVCAPNRKSPHGSLWTCSVRNDANRASKLPGHCAPLVLEKLPDPQ